MELEAHRRIDEEQRKWQDESDARHSDQSTAPIGIEDVLAESPCATNHQQTINASPGHLGGTNENWDDDDRVPALAHSGCAYEPRSRAIANEREGPRVENAPSISGTEVLVGRPSNTRRGDASHHRHHSSQKSLRTEYSHPPRLDNSMSVMSESENHQRKKYKIQKPSKIRQALEATQQERPRRLTESLQANSQESYEFFKPRNWPHPQLRVLEPSQEEYAALYIECSENNCYKEKKDCNNHRISDLRDMRESVNICPEGECRHGVKAKRPFLKDELVGEYIGNPKTQKYLDRRRQADVSILVKDVLPKLIVCKLSYVVKLPRGGYHLKACFLDAKDLWDHTSRINHICRGANCRFELWIVDEAGEFFSLRYADPKDENVVTQHFSDGCKCSYCLRLLWCICRKAGHGRMIECGGAFCEDVWFHFTCIGMQGTVPRRQGVTHNPTRIFTLGNEISNTNGIARSIIEALRMQMDTL